MPGMPGPRAPDGPPGATGATGPAPNPAPGGNDRTPVDSASNNVRSNFPETWIWTDAMTGYVIAVKAVWYTATVTVIKRFVC